MLVVLIVSAATLLLVAGFAQDFVRLRLIPRLSQPSAERVDYPFVSILIPARNEERNIAGCLDGVLHQRYPHYEVIVVDDHSTDATAAILASYARRDKRVRVVQGAPLPPGWTGKCNACQQAANVARADWLLFLDADTVPHPDLLAALMLHAQRRQYDMLTIFPFLVLVSFWERVIMPPFQAMIYTVFPVERLNDRHARPDEVLANGWCMLVRRAAYEAVGGHRAVHNEVLEDVRLAQVLRRAGFHLGAAEGRQYLCLRMYTNIREIIEGLSKNAEAGYRSGGNRSFWAGVRQVVLAFGPIDLLMGGVFLVLMYGDVLAWAVFLHGLVVVCIAGGFWSWFLRQHYGLPWGYALLWPFGVLCYSTIALRGMWRVRSGRGVIWKGRTYVGR